MIEWISTYMQCFPQRVYHGTPYFNIFFFYKCFDQMWLNEQTRIAQVANINQFPGADSFTSPPKNAGDKHLFIFEGRAK